MNIQPDLVPEDVNAASLTDVDTEVSAVQPPLADSEILAEFFKTGNNSDGDDEVMGYAWKSDLLLALEFLLVFNYWRGSSRKLFEDRKKDG